MASVCGVWQSTGAVWRSAPRAGRRDLAFVCVAAQTSGGGRGRFQCAGSKKCKADKSASDEQSLLSSGSPSEKSIHHFKLEKGWEEALSSQPVPVEQASRLRGAAAARRRGGVRLRAGGQRLMILR